MDSRAEGGKNSNPNADGEGSERQKFTRLRKMKTMTMTVNTNKNQFKTLQNELKLAKQKNPPISPQHNPILQKKFENIQENMNEDESGVGGSILEANMKEQVFDLSDGFFTPLDVNNIVNA